MTSPAVLWVWGITVAAIAIVIVPLAVYLLHRTLTASRSIERYLRESLEAGRGIAANTEAVTALEETIAIASSLLGTTRKIQQHTAAIPGALRGTAEDRGVAR
jgi:hypothetical protein